MQTPERTQQMQEKCLSMVKESQSFAIDDCNLQGETNQAQSELSGPDENKTRVNNHHSTDLEKMVVTTIIDQQRPAIKPTSPINCCLTTDDKPTSPINCCLTTDDVLTWHPAISWDPLCHVDYRYLNACDGHMSLSTLPHDLKFVETSELLPMAHDDFTKYLEEDLSRSSSENVSTYDDCVVPSLSPILQDVNIHCLDSSPSSSQTSSDWSQEYDATDTRTCKETGNSRPRPCGSTFGTLNWGLLPTIIYKTPGPETAVDIGNVPMKCSITEGNVELITPPPLNCSKLRRRRCRRKSRFPRSRRRILFEDYTRHTNDEGVQEVPIYDNQEMDENPVSDHVPEDPMWFKEDDEWEDCVQQGNLRTCEEDLEMCYANLRNILPKNGEATSRQQILDVAVKHIDDLQKRVNRSEDVFGVLPQFSWSDIDEPSYEIQAILEKLVPSTPAANELDQFSTLAATELDQSWTPPSSLINKEAPKKKRKYGKTAFTKSVRTKKTKSKSTTRKCKPVEVDTCTPENSQETRKNCCNTTSGSKRNNALESTVQVGDSQESPCGTPGRSSVTVYNDRNRPTPSMKLLSPKSSYYPITGLFPLQTIGKPLILPKPSSTTPFSSPSASGDMLTISSNVSLSGSPLLTSSFPLIAPRMSMPNSSCPSPSYPLSPLTSLARNIMVHAPLTWFQSSPVQWTSSQELVDCSDNEGRHENSDKVKRKTNGYMLYCKKKRSSLFIENPDLKSDPGAITKLLSQNWKKLTEEEKRPYIEEAIKEAMNSEWINETPD